MWSLGEIEAGTAFPQGAVSPIQPLAHTACGALRRSPYRELHEVSCEYHDGVLTLRGRVSSYYLKQIAQNLVWQMEGVVGVDNQLDVLRPPIRPRVANGHSAPRPAPGRRPR